VAILHNERPVTWTVVDNAVLRDPGLSWRAKGLLAYLLGLPDGWRVNSADLANRATDGIYAVRSIFDELEEAGYLHREKRQNVSGKWSTHITITGAPFTGDGFTGVGGLNERPEETRNQPMLAEPIVGSTDVGEIAPLGKTQEGSTQEEGSTPSEIASATEAPQRSLAQLELDAIKEALVGILGEPTQRNGWALVNRVAVMIRDHGGGPGDVLDRAALMAKDWGSEKVTLTSLEKHWGRYDPGKIGRLSRAEVDAFARTQETQARSAQRLREVEERAGENDPEAYHAEMQRVRGEQHEM
jgi:hypothetical protein